MREPARDKERLNHILESIGNIEEGSKDMSYDDLVRDKFMRHALTWNIQVIGEAANHLSKEFIGNHPQTDWRGIIGLRNVLVHDYYHIDEEDLWNVIEKDLPPLKQQIEQYLAEME